MLTAVPVLTWSFWPGGLLVGGVSPGPAFDCPGAVRLASRALLRRVAWRGAWGAPGAPGCDGRRGRRAVGGAAGCPGRPGSVKAGSLDGFRAMLTMEGAGPGERTCRLAPGGAAAGTRGAALCARECGGTVPGWVYRHHEPRVPAIPLPGGAGLLSGRALPLVRPAGSASPQLPAGCGQYHGRAVRSPAWLVLRQHWPESLSATRGSL